MNRGWGALPSDLLHEIHLALAEQLSASGRVTVRQAEAAAAALGAVNRHWRQCLQEQPVREHRPCLPPQPLQMDKLRRTPAAAARSWYARP